MISIRYESRRSSNDGQAQILSLSDWSHYFQDGSRHVEPSITGDLKSTLKSALMYMSLIDTSAKYLDRGSTPLYYYSSQQEMLHIVDLLRSHEPVASQFAEHVYSLDISRFGDKLFAGNISSYKLLEPPLEGVRHSTIVIGSVSSQGTPIDVCVRGGL